ncbi:MAG: aminotransferase class V-fold PLP-dependent enzyme [Solibacillus sp.]|uniref:aminotransferase class V-fold PLP-dependent enzyme n=1 Tax=unclassified Solibacillus TaxID=2637870 RepID=UPI0030F72160
MYWSKIATTEKEFDQIAQLNYETFVEEIPQHGENTTRRLIDKFHAENVYLVVYKNTELVGMVAFRDHRPFSIDQKIGEVEQHLDARLCESLCELRLLAVKKEHRNGRVFSKLATAIYRHFYDKGYTACVISGTVREEKMYTQMGFKQFAPPVGTKEALYLPMVLTREASHVFRERLREQNNIFYPGPVSIETPFLHSTLSHRSEKFQQDLTWMKDQLCQLAGANGITPLVGTGTLANDAMLGQLKSEFKTEPGLLLCNGEFGARLIKQAQQWGLQFDTLNFGFGHVFRADEIEQKLKEGNYHYIVFVHGETSNSTLNPLEAIVLLGEKYNVKVCADCISSFGALPFSMAGLHYATAVSGKALGTVAGLSFVFWQEAPTESQAPMYMNLSHYYDKQIPYTLPHTFVQAVNNALTAYPERFTLLQKRMELVRHSALKEMLVGETYPMIATIQHKKIAEIVEACELNGYLLHGASGYLKERSLAQISTIQPNFEKDFQKVNRLIGYLLEVV